MGASSSSLDADLRRIEQSALWVVEVDAGQGASMKLQIRKLETVGTLRRRAAQELGLPEEELELVLAGDVLAEMAATAESVAIRDVSWECGGGWSCGESLRGGGGCRARSWLCGGRTARAWRRWRRV